MKIAFISLVALCSQFAWAGGHGDVTCDANWKICLESGAMDMNDTIHYVTTIYVQGKTMDLNSSSTLVIHNSDSKVSLNNGSFVLGSINPSVGEDTHYAMSRELVPAHGVNFAITEQPGRDVELCNKTATGIFYEYYDYHTVDQELNITVGGNPFAQLKGSRFIYPPFHVKTSMKSCP